MKNPLEMSWINILRRNVANDSFFISGTETMEILSYLVEKVLI